ncbi:MAG: CoA-binding protein [Chloroflexi bacterium]|nr:CoA-binding protein [Chloroflexota bacterium]
MKTEFNRFFAPRSLAFLGASTDTTKWGFRILANIVTGGFQGKIYPVNPKGGEVLGLKVYSSIEEIPEAPDLAIIVVPPAGMVETIKQCVSKGIKTAVVVTAGFAEVNQSGAEVQEEIVRLARQGGLRLIGPNCFGILSPSAKLYAQMPPIFPPDGQLAVVSQSGNVGLTIARRAMALDFGCSRMISIGNEADLHAEDFLEYLAGDDKTKVILSYIEGLKDGRRFFEVAKNTSFKKPIVMIKVGETEAGASAARSHTAALSGSAEVFNGVSRQAGIVRANNLQELMNLAYGFLCHPIPKGRRVGIATLGGGWGVLAADACARLGLDVIKLPADVVSELDSFLPVWWSRNNPVDTVAGSADNITRVVDILAKSDATDAVLALGVPFPHFARMVLPTNEEEKNKFFEFIIESYCKSFGEMSAISQKYGKPVIVAAELPTLRGERAIDTDIIRSIAKRNMVCYSMPDEAAMVLNSMVKYGEFLRNG